MAISFLLFFVGLFWSVTTLFVSFLFFAGSSGVMGTSGSSGGLMPSPTLALLRIVSPAFASSLTITLKRILRSFVSVILGYSAVIVPLASFKLVGFGSSPTLVRLSLTYVSPFGSWSVITTLFRTPFSMVLRKLIVYSIVSPSFGLALLTVLLRLVCLLSLLVPPAPLVLRAD